MDAKHIPSALHSHAASRNGVQRKRRDTVSFVRRIKREAKKIAPPPVFFNNEATKNRVKTGNKKNFLQNP